MNLTNLLPQDTRVSEIAGAFAIILVSLSLALDGPITDAMHQLHPPVFWAVVLGAFGALQVASLVFQPALEPLRVLLALTNGGWWVWLAMTSTPDTQTPGDIGAFFLGLSNLYGSAIGFLFLRRKWES